MAISPLRLKSGSILDTVKTEFISPTDKSKDTPTNKQTNALDTIKSKLNKKAILAGKDKFLSDTIENVESLSNKLGIFDGTIDLGCSGSINMKGDPTADNRNLLKAGKSECNDNLTSVMDSVFKTTIVVDKYLGKMSDAGLANIEGMVSKEVSNLVKKTSLNKDSISFEKITSKIVAKTGGIGGSLSVKNLIGSIGDLCNHSAGMYSAGDLSMFKDFLLSTALNIGDCLSPDNLLGLVKDIITTGIGKPTDIVMGFIGNFNTAEDPKVGKKISILSSILNNSAEDITPKDKIKMKKATGVIMKSLGTSKTKSLGPVTDYYLTTAALDNIDYNWDKDDSGNSNYGKTKDNKYMTSLASSRLKSAQPKDKTLSGTATLDVNKVRELGITASNIYSKGTNYISMLKGI